MSVKRIATIVTLSILLVACGKPQDAPHAKVLLIGLDGAEWDRIDPLIAQGELPNLARLKRDGVHGPLESFEPILSPIIWTSIATGKTPEKHGIGPRT